MHWQAPQSHAYGLGAAGVGPGLTLHVAGCDNYDQRRQAYHGGCDLLGEYDAALEVFVIQPKCEPVACADRGCEGHLVASNADCGWRRKMLCAQRDLVRQAQAPASLGHRFRGAIYGGEAQNWWCPDIA